METMQPVLKRGRDVWDRINMPQSEFQERVEKIKKEMEKEDLDVLLLYGRGVNEYGNSCYASNFVIGMQRGALVAIPRKGEIALIFEGFPRALPTVRTKTWIKEIRACGNISRECVKYLKEGNFIPSTIGLAGLKQLMPYHQLRFLRESLSQCKIVDSSDIIEDMRMVKSRRECDEIHRSSRILAQAFSSISNFDIPSSNMNEKVLEAIMGREAYLEGAEDFRMLVARPLEGKWAFRPAEDAQILPEGSIIVYLAVEFERYWSEGIRTFVVNHSSFTEPEFERGKALYESIISRMKPGKTLSQFYKEAIEEIQKSGIDYMPEYGLGQGIGLSLQEPPVIAEEDMNQLRDGMCLTLRLAMKDKGVGAIVMGNTIHLLKGRSEVLTKLIKVVERKEES